MTQTEFVEQRTHFIGGSDVPAILGYDPYKGPLKVWAGKVGLHIPDEIELSEINEAVWWGTKMQPLIIERFNILCAEAGVEYSVVEPVNPYISNDYPFLGGNLDGVVHHVGGKQGVFEVKTTDTTLRRNWGLPWTDQVPEGYLFQVQHYMYVTGMEYAIIYVKFGNRESVVYYVERNNRLIESFVPKMVAFWNDYVLTKDPPPPDASKSSEEIIRALYPNDTGEIIIDDPKINELASLLEQAKLHRDSFSVTYDKIKQEIELTMKEASLAEGLGYKFSYRQQKGRSSVNWPDAVNTIGNQFGVPQADITAIVESKTTHGTPIRVFRPNFYEVKNA